MPNLIYQNYSKKKTMKNTKKKQIFSFGFQVYAIFKPPLFYFSFFILYKKWCLPDKDEEDEDRNYGWVRVGWLEH